VGRNFFLNDNTPGPEIKPKYGLRRRWPGSKHYATAQWVKGVLQRNKDLQDIIAILASTSFPTTTSWWCRAPSS